MLEKGEIDILSDVSYTAERTEKMLFPTYAMGTEEYYLYIRIDHAADFNDDYSYFNGKKVGVNKGSIQTGMFREWTKQNNISAELTEVTAMEYDALDMVRNGELDGYITVDTFVVEDSLVPAVKIGSSDFYFAVSKSRPDLLNELENALSRIQDENRFYDQEMFEKYMQNVGASRFLNKDEKEWLTEHSTIRVGYLDNYLAYCDEDEKTEELTGALKDFLEKASGCFANAEIDFEPHSYSTVADALAALENGEADCIFPANFSMYDGETKGIMLTPAMTNATLNAVVRISEQQSFSAITQAKVALVTGDTNYESIIKDLYPDWETVYCDDIEGCLKAVASGKADCFLISSYRYNSIVRLCEKYHLTALDTSNYIPFFFAVSDGNTELYSILAKATNIIPDSYVNNALTHYFSEEGKPTLLDIIKDNIIIVIAVIVIMAAMFMQIIVQRRLINAERKAKEQRRIADNLSRRVYVDALTSVQNKGGYTDYVITLQDRLDQGEVTEFAICMFDCDDLKYINDEFGHEKGDVYLKTATRLICRIFPHSPVFRIGGDEFISILQNKDFDDRNELIKKFEEESKAINEATENDWENINISLGMAEYDPKTDRSINDTVTRADEKMYENKRKRKAERGVR